MCGVLLLKWTLGDDRGRGVNTRCHWCSWHGNMRSGGATHLEQAKQYFKTIFWIWLGANTGYCYTTVSSSSINSLIVTEIENNLYKWHIPGPRLWQWSQLACDPDIAPDSVLSSMMTFLTPWWLHCVLEQDTGDNGQAGVQHLRNIYLQFHTSASMDNVRGHNIGFGQSYGQLLARLEFVNP